DLEMLVGEPTGLTRLHLAWNRLWYGAPLGVPLGISTFGDTPELAADLDTLAAGRVDVAELRGRDLAQLEEIAPRGLPEPALEAPAPEPVEVIEAEVVEAVAEPEPEVELPAPVAPLRDLHRPVRADVRIEPEVPAQRRPEEIAALLAGVPI